MPNDDEISGHDAFEIFTLHKCTDADYEENFKDID